MSTKKRRYHTKEFKEEAVKLVTEQGYAVAEAARNLGINYNVLSRWKKKYDTNNGDDVNSGSVTTMQAELKRLRKEVKQLRLEREILKKAATFFAKEQG